MRDIKRYDHDPDTGAISAYPDGQLVDFNDHQAAIKQAKIDAVWEFANAVWDSGELTGRDGEFLIGFAHQHIKELPNDE